MGLRSALSAWYIFDCKDVRHLGEYDLGPRQTRTEKADARKQGVETESQIISQEVYEQVEQTKFIPIVCEFKNDGTPYFPIFLQSRIW